jgi:outer membrane protein assembly factor BamD
VRVATYYFNRGAYLAAINRAQSTLVNYPQTASNEDALILLVRSYDRLEMKQLSDDARQVLAKTFPESPFLTGANKPWWKFW